MSNRYDNVLYIGVTNNIERRIYEHKNHLKDGFTKKYNLSKLVYLEETKDIQFALKREKQLKGWTRAKKEELINKYNAKWLDLSVNYDDI